MTTGWKYPETLLGLDEYSANKCEILDLNKDFLTPNYYYYFVICHVVKYGDFTEYLKVQYLESEKPAFTMIPILTSCVDLGTFLNLCLFFSIYKIEVITVFTL